MDSSVYRRVFVLGSGFSKSYCPKLPTLKDLSALLPDKVPEDFPTLRDYCMTFHELCNGQPEYMGIEAIATAILSTRMFPSESERLYYVMLRFELLRFIAGTISLTDPLPRARHEELRRFLLKVANPAEAQTGKTLLISFNYDTLIEDCLREDEELSQRLAVNFGLNLDFADRKEGRSFEATVDLLKLHGSLDWYQLKGSVDTLDVRSICRVVPGDKSFPIYSDDTPVFIPMAHSKHSFLHGSLFNILWAKADYYLKTAPEIYCVGYGFPQTDINNLEFLLRHRERIAKVVVFEPEGDPDMLRLTRLFGPGKVASCDARKFLGKLE